MKKYFLIVVFVIQTLSLMVARTGADGECMLLVTDRGLYVTGEKIHFSCRLIPGKTENQAVSTVAYIELITPAGEKILVQKRTIQNGTSTGSVTIPVEIMSGNYYLRAYTKVMRNRPAETFSYCLLKIVNPARSEVLEFNEYDPSDHPASLEQMDLFSGYQIRVDSDTIGPREAVLVKLKKEEAFPGQVMHTIVSIVPGISRKQKVLAVDGIPNGNTMPQAYSVESDGLTISGTVTEQDRPVPLNITLLEPEHNNYYPVKTDSTGRFSFVFAEKYGEQDLFVSFN